MILDKFVWINVEVNKLDFCMIAALLISISISKFPAWASRPAVLASAPVVFETLIDEGQTRLQALYYCGYPEKVAGV